MLGEEETPTDSLAFLCVGCGGGVVEGGRWTGGEGWSGGGQTAGGRSGHDQTRKQTRYRQDWLGCSNLLDQSPSLPDLQWEVGWRWVGVGLVKECVMQLLDRA